MINPPRHPELFQACTCEHCPAPAEYAVTADRTYCVCTACLRLLADNHDWGAAA